MSLFDPQGLVWKLATLLVVSLLFTSFPASAQDTNPDSPIMVPNPASDLWRSVRQREAPGIGGTQVQGVETGVLIQSSGEDFRKYRRDDFIRLGAMVLGGVLAVLLAFYLIRGKMRIPDGRSGKLVKRFPDFDRTVHWLMTVLFLFLALTGLILLFGRFVVLPVFGPEAFGMIASACKEGHNLFGPLFLVALLLMFVRYVARNIPTLTDLKWLLKAGGMIGKGHASAGFFNGGEKIWFWAVIVLGILLSVSGLVLLFPVLGQGREIMQLALIVHGAAAVLVIAGSFGHMYIATIGMEGALESMTTGYVDESWAEAHHDEWYAEVKQQQQSVPNEGATTSLRPSADKA